MWSTFRLLDEPDELFDALWPEPPRIIDVLPVAMPAALYQSRRGYRLIIQVPGHASSEVSAEADRGELVIRAGNAERRLRLPDDALIEKSQARHRLGELEIRIPRARAPRTRRIRVRRRD